MVVVVVDTDVRNIGGQVIQIALYMCVHYFVAYKFNMQPLKCHKREYKLSLLVAVGVDVRLEVAMLLQQLFRLRDVMRHLFLPTARLDVRQPALLSSTVEHQQ